MPYNDKRVEATRWLLPYLAAPPRRGACHHPVQSHVSDVHFPSLQSQEQEQLMMSNHHRQSDFTDDIEEIRKTVRPLRNLDRLITESGIKYHKRSSF